ncbi:MAG: L,D-transpeptidase [Solirubrobacteraceae bacterium]
MKLVRHFQTIGSPWLLAHGVSRVSNGYTDTVVAESGGTGAVYANPGFGARVITHLRLNTPDDEALQSYLVVGQRVIHHRAWVLIDVPMRPNGTLGWVPRSSLGSYIESDEQIIVDRAAHTLFLCKAGREVFHSPVGVGRASMVTPTGRFWVTEAFLSTDPEYGPWAFGTSDLATLHALHAGFGDGGMVGIHGTDKPWLIPGNPSHGCVRLPNADILRLKQLVGVGASIWVQ